ncbi:hypothetical protein [Dokdonella soli]|uniref:DUF4476 domain-containing protein n=1 Tax=Dokdonella soli TaxID=529810 RepID=A0ABN1J1P6_9GAMM
MSAMKIRGLWWKLMLGVAVTGAIAAVSATATSIESGLQDAKTGTVLDSATKQPIQGAYVVVRWYRYHVDRWFFGHGGRGGAECIYRMVAKTDADGRYTFLSTDGKFDIRRELSLQFDNRYFWDLGTYAPGYFWGWPQNMYQSGGKHPAAHGIGSQALDPIELTRRPLGSGEFSFNEFECPGADSNAVPFIDQIYKEGYSLACEHGGVVLPRQVAELREHAVGVMRPLPGDLSTQLDDIRKHYRFNDPPSAEDDAHICAILKQANEVLL